MMLAALCVLRQFRCKVVQTPSQYVFIHQVLVDAIAQKVGIKGCVIAGCKRVSQEKTNRASVVSSQAIQDPFVSEGALQLTQDYSKVPTVCRSPRQTILSPSPR